MSRNESLPVISEYHYYVFEQIESRGLQFLIPKEWRPMYRDYLQEKKVRKIIETFEIARDEFLRSKL